MILQEFNKSPSDKIKELNTLLREQFGFSLSRKTPSKKQLEKLHENAQSALATLRSGGKKFQLDPDYAKFLCIRDLSQTMMESGMYAESPAYTQMCGYVNETVKDLMDSGYTAEEACSECMNRYRQDSRYAYDDEFVLPIVLRAAKDYVREYGHHGTGQRLEELEEDSLQPAASAGLVRRIAKESGIRMESMHSLDEIDLKLEQYARTTGKTRGAVIEFLESLDDKKLSAGIQMFDRKLAETNAFIAARRDAIKKGKKEFKIDGETYPVTGADSAEVKSIRESAVKEKSTSQAQQKAAGAALAAKRGDAPKSKLRGASKEMMDMSMDDLEDFASTKHKGLPKKKTNEDRDYKDYNDAVEDVASAIFYRLRVSHQDQIKSVPTSEVQRAVFDVAERRAEDEVDELGSSDVSILVDEVLGELGINNKTNEDAGSYSSDKDYKAEKQNDGTYTVWTVSFGDKQDMVKDGLTKQSAKKLIDKLYAEDLGIIETKQETNENYLSLDDMMIAEDVDIEQAEVVIAVRALVSDLQDHVERLGRMVNEELPAIADQVRTEMGADQAQSFLDSTTELLSTQLEATRTAKEGMDQAVGMLTGEEIGGLGDTGELGGDDLDMDIDDDLGLDDEISDNIDAASGPEDEPLGRAKI